MSKPGFSFGLNLTKKPGASKPPPPKRKPIFSGDDDDSDDEGRNRDSKVEEIGGDVEGFGSNSTRPESARHKPKTGIPTQPPKLKSKKQTSTMFGDLSSSLVSRKNAEQASELDPSVYEYDAVYDSLKPKKRDAEDEAKDRRPRYMQGLMQAAEVRKRDALIAEEKKIAREREAEGDEYANTEKFVTEAYKKQQEDNRRIEEEEKRREAAEAKKNEGGGMSAFYRTLLERGEQQHAEAVKAAEDVAKNGPKMDEQDEEPNQEKTESDVANELNKKGASIALNEEGQVVDKRELLKGGLNVDMEKQGAVQQQEHRPAQRDRRPAGGMQFGKNAMRERQSQMFAEQLMQSLKRSHGDEAAEQDEEERAAKSQKIEDEILSAKER